MRVLSATADDTARIAALERECIDCAWSEQNIRYALGESRYRFFKIEEGGELAGYAGVEIVEGDANVQNVAVAPRFRRLGYGRALMEAVIAAARAGGAERVMLEVDEGNAAAIGLYRDLGFSAIGERKRYYGERTALVMQLTF